MDLSMLKVGEQAKIIAVHGKSDTVKRLYVMGLTKGVVVTLIRLAPLNCPLEIKLRDFYLALRVDDCHNIEVVYV